MQDKTRTKIYDKTILRRFFTFLKPYKKLMALAILFLAFTSIFDLAIPYITKTAIDRNIIPHYVEVTQPEQLDSRFMNRTVILTDGRVLLDISKVSRADKAELEKEGLLGKTRFIIVNKLIKGKAEYFIPTQNNKYAIPENSLKNFNKKEIRILGKGTSEQYIYLQQFFWESWSSTSYLLLPRFTLCNMLGRE